MECVTFKLKNSMPVQDDFDLADLTKVYLVSCRIKRTWTNMGEHGKVGTISREINMLWESLSQFFLGTSIMVCESRNIRTFFLVSVYNVMS